MPFLRLLAITALAALSLPALAQTTPRGVEKQARADRKMERAHTVKHGESMSKEPRLIRTEDRLDHRKAKARR
jgi:hypothetical protein